MTPRAGRGGQEHAAQRLSHPESATAPEDTDRPPPATHPLWDKGRDTPGSRHRRRSLTQAEQGGNFSPNFPAAFPTLQQLLGPLKGTTEKKKTTGLRANLVCTPHQQPQAEGPPSSIPQQPLTIQWECPASGMSCLGNVLPGAQSWLVQLAGSRQLWHRAESEFTLQLQTCGDVSRDPTAAASLSLPFPQSTTEPLSLLSLTR